MLVGSAQVGRGVSSQAQETDSRRDIRGRTSYHLVPVSISRTGVALREPLGVEDPVAQAQNRRDELGQKAPGKKCVIPQPSIAHALGEDVSGGDPPTIPVIVEPDFVNALQSCMKFFLRPPL